MLDEVKNATACQVVGTCTRDQLVEQFGDAIEHRSES